MSYKIITSKTGRIMYFKDGVMTSKAQWEKDTKPIKPLRNDGVFTETLEENGVPVTNAPPVETSAQKPVEPPKTVDQPTPVEPQSRQCVICGAPGRQRFLNGQTIYVCLEDLETHTTGEIVEQMRNRHAVEAG